MIRTIKKAIDFAMFSANTTFPDYEGQQRSKLGMFLQLCQQQIDGMATTPTTIDPNSEAKLRELKRKLQEKIQDLEREKTSASKSAKNELDRRIQELKDAQRELETIITSTINYKFQIDNRPEFSYDGITNRGTIKYDGTIGSLMNELKHAYQFETSQIDFYHDKNNLTSDPIPGLTYDIYDEIETYKRQYAYDGILKFTIALSAEEIIEANKLRHTKDFLGIGRVDIKKMKNIKANIIIKVADGYALDPLYNKISQKKLGVNSFVKDVISANKQRPVSVNFLGVKNFDKNKPYIEFVKVYISQNKYLYVKF